MTGYRAAAGGAIGATLAVGVSARSSRAENLGPALRASARVSLACFVARLAGRSPETRRQATLAMAGAHAVHTALVATYLLRGRPHTGPGRLPTVAEIGGGALGYVALLRVTVDAIRGSDNPGDLAEAYLAGLFAADFANEALRKGPSGRRAGTLSLSVLGVGVARRLRGR